MEEEMLESEEIPGGPPVIIHSRQKGTPVFGRKSSKVFFLEISLEEKIKFKH